MRLASYLMLIQIRDKLGQAQFRSGKLKAGRRKQQNAVSFHYFWRATFAATLLQ